MDELLSAVLDAHGGLDNWQKAITLTARLSLGGPFWAARGWPDLPSGQTVTLDAHRQHVESTPFLAGLRALVAAIPPEHRAAVMAAFFVAAYASLSVPAVLAGVLVTHISLQSTFEIFGGAVAAIALGVALQAWRTRPKQRRVRLTTPAPAQP